MKNFRTGSRIGLVLLCAAVLSACSANAAAPISTSNNANISVTADQSSKSAEVQLANVTAADLMDFDEDDTVTAWTAADSTAITLAGTSAAVDGSGATANGASVTITEAGTYVLSGTLSNGQIIVDEQAKGTVRLVLNGARLTDSDSAPIYIKEAGKVVLTLQEGTENSVTDGAAYVFADGTEDEPSAAVFSKADLTINGNGKLTVTGNYNDGITGKDDLKIMSGTIEVQAADDGIVGKDLVAIQDGSITIRAEGDGIKSTNDEAADKGFIAIAAGTFDITAGNDGIQAETSAVIDGGTYTLVTGGGYVNAAVKTGDQGGPGMGGGFGQRPAGGDFPDPGAAGGTPPDMDAAAITATAAVPSPSPAQTATAGAPDTTDTAVAAETESASRKGLKAGGDLTVGGGSFTIDSADDAVHSNGSISIRDGEFQIATGDDGIHADSLTSLSGGTINITKSYEGIEGANITVSGGEIHVVATDDSVNVAGGNDNNATAGGTQAQDSFSSTGSNLLTISGGTLTVDAAGDGLDSNGSVTMTGGTVIVNGPENSGNGALDYDGTFNITGGFLVAAGASGMAQAPGGDSSQHSVSISFTETQQAGTMVHLEDADGNPVLTFTPAKSFQTVVLSAPELKDGKYTVYTGGSSTGTAADGLYTGGAYSAGTEFVSFDITSAVTWVNESGVTTGGSGMGGPGGGGGRGNRTGGGPGGQGGTPPADAGTTRPADAGTTKPVDAGATAPAGAGASKE
ncbi:carbohydrate-binding domain-containing protein [Paenibacillus tritici]|uniref:Carbohydrate-binding domain-containing protein n=1 Tax=Paenibacillus tritici TaxID=1873425 RepID=A0ABX2DP76_9BACL|nr:carbohydrate-binding domain-containing protein [Paenibacillus tritici]NQX46425.1 carbohydrate-binding domain-containing protein [Paenibacillus tritici]